jgi:hypothetical protein
VRAGMRPRELISAEGKPGAGWSGEYTEAGVEATRGLFAVSDGG